ncbi:MULTISPECIES: FAD-dependent oxidoreductase [unclassified Chelatococcus]|uniref:FAD-dependent oxidoreductase n=1 Tax=unclassified Chelatococcus TaxID=2638111 RepID=UPI001BCE9E68|nr:FAD-dependent oxidoreductase [Chelatococcus sp.]MBS7739754.1 FAD-dependent oxidoreductase [Chelatococcus sp. HY11]MBX3544123.1 FAD-dependent oxidoreductase [Chelatococcus sp.]CAH1650594.1 2-polyprenyl-6-methoxyphenol hydroxylase-like FAD-dependent oxidoreductase [Hyphomicrobiales bacterium]CAH1666155.1 2-polyprenyl-6-methoxyphenol hydroxylase-like FAD-dependent oxidoreductase [Hyphomicrobiales bacterium]
MKTGGLARIKTGCAIVGAGPAGLMLGLLLARAGIDVIVTEKHGDFLRDFRGDTIHPSTLEVMHELGLLQGLLALPHTKAASLHAEIDGSTITIADFSRLPTQCRFIAFMPQWEFLSYIASEAARFSNFHLVMNAEVEALREVDGKVTGIRARTPDGDLEISAGLVIGADGRNSRIREYAGLEVENFGSPSDVLWMRLSRQPGDPVQAMGHAGPRHGFVMIDRADYWQCGYVVRKGSFADVRERGLDAFRQEVASVSPLPAGRLDEIASWDDIHLLSVRIDRLKRWWRPGLLCIGDAAHAMSPIGGVGVNLAIQDAVAAANILAGPLSEGTLTSGKLAAVEARRRFPTRATQKLQLMMRRDKRKREADLNRRSGPPAFMRGIARWPALAHLAGRLIGLGFRPEHVRPRP